MVVYFADDKARDLVIEMAKKHKIRNVITTEYLKEAIAYLRYSSHKQDGGVSLEYQIKTVLEYADRNQIKITGWYIDTAKSATEVAGRDNFIQLFDNVDRGDVPPNLIIFATNRAFRNNGESANYRALLRNKGVLLHSATQNIDESTSSGRMHVNMLSAIDQYQSETISDFVSAATRYLISEGFFAGGLPPYGYKSETVIHNGKERVVVRPYEPEAIVVRELFDGIIAGKNLNQISRDFKAKGYQTKRGNPFQWQTLRAMLSNIIYKGERKYKMKTGVTTYSEEYCPPIVSKEVFGKANNIFEESKRRIKGRKRKNLYPLTGKLVCGDCGRALVGSTSNQYSYYYCQARFVCQQECCAKRIQRVFLDEKAFDAVREKLLSDKAIEDITKKVLAEIKKAPAEAESKEALTERKSMLEKEITEIVEMKVKNQITESVMITMTKDKNAELFDIEQKLSAFTASADKSIDAAYIKRHIKATFNKDIPFELCSGEMLKELFHQTIDKIEVSNTQVVIHLRIPLPNFTHKTKQGNTNFGLCVKIPR